jgi:hypothetical protein
MDKDYIEKALSLHHQMKESTSRLWMLREDPFRRREDLAQR